MRSKGGENNTGRKGRMTQRRGEEKNLESQIKRRGEKSKNNIVSEDEKKKNPGRRTVRWKEGRE